MAEFRGGSATVATYPAAKKVLLDKYAEIALFDANENDRHIDGDKQKAAASSRSSAPTWTSRSGSSRRHC